LGGGVNYSVKEIYQQVAKLVGSETIPVYRPDLKGEAEETLADIYAARALGWQPKITLQQGLASFVDYYRTRGVPQLEN
jgi:nucleoside-diphosphate-sugar epimerase